MFLKYLLGLILGLFVFCAPCYAQEGYSKTYVNTDYPRISALEQSVFHNNYKNDEVYSRLNRLETRVLGRTFPSLSLSERTERLERILNRTTSNNDLPEGNERILIAVSALEQRVFRQTFPNSTIISRLNRLEEKLLGASQSGDAEQRIALLADLTSSQQSQYPSSFGSFGQSFYSSSQSYPQSESFGSSSSQYGQSMNGRQYGVMDVIQTILMELLNGYTGRYNPSSYPYQQMGGTNFYPASSTFYPSNFYPRQYYPNQQRSTFGNYGVGSSVRILD